MALFSNRFFCRFYIKQFGLKPLTIIKNKCDKIVTLDIDSLDEFTNQLIQRKVDKWNMQDMGYKLANHQHLLKDIKPSLDLKHITEERLNSLIQEKIEMEDNSAIIEIAQQCIELMKCPNVSNIMYILALCAQRGNKTMILSITEMCRSKMPQILETNSKFQHFLAQSIWVNGNIHDSLNLFEEVYNDNPYLRRQIRLILKSLIGDVICNRSEAVLVTVVKFCEKLYKNYQDIFPLLYIWQTCFLSEWFHDQEVALELLNRYINLRKSVISRLQYVVTVSLRSHRTEIVYRLLEVLLRYDMKSHYPEVILALLNYQIHQRDLKGCIETIRWSLENDVNLPAVHNERFLNLVLNQDDGNIINKKGQCASKKLDYPSKYKF